MPDLVAVTCSTEISSDRRRALVARYVVNAGLPKSLAVAGSQALVLPHAADLSPADAEAILAPLTGLIVTGGDFDIPPSRYGEAPHPKLGKIDPLRTHFEATLMQAAFNIGLPVLGLCAGMQLLNVVLGGTLVQDVSLWPNALEHEQRVNSAMPSHAVRVEPHTRLARALGTADRFGAEVMVNSTHHQVVGRLGRGLRACAVASDGVIEAIEPVEQGRDQPFWLGIQWHPELLADDRQDGIIRSLVDAGRKRHSAGQSR